MKGLGLGFDTGRWHGGRARETAHLDIIENNVVLDAGERWRDVGEDDSVRAAHGCS
jgi:hypothetical protein